MFEIVEVFALQLLAKHFDVLICLHKITSEGSIKSVPKVRGPPKEYPQSPEIT